MSTLLRIFKSLEEKGLIKKEGKGENIYYMTFLLFLFVILNFDNYPKPNYNKEGLR